MDITGYHGEVVGLAKGGIPKPAETVCEGKSVGVCASLNPPSASIVRMPEKLFTKDTTSLKLQPTANSEGLWRYSINGKRCFADGEQTCSVNSVWIHRDTITVFQPDAWKWYRRWYFTCVHCEKSIAHNVILRLNSSSNSPAIHSSDSNMKAIYKHWGQGHMINTERGIPGFFRLLHEWQGRAPPGRCVWMCIRALVAVRMNRGGHRVRWGVKVRSPGDWLLCINSARRLCHSAGTPHRWGTRSRCRINTPHIFRSHSRGSGARRATTKTPTDSRLQISHGMLTAEVNYSWRRLRPGEIVLRGDCSERALVKSLLSQCQWQ